MRLQVALDKGGTQVALSLPDVGISVVSLGLFLLTVSSQASRTSITWEVLETADSQPPGQTY